MLRINQVDVWYLDDIHSNRVCGAYASLLNQEEIERANSYAFEQHRRRFRYVRGVLKQLLGYYSRRRVEEITLHFTDYGKPYIGDPIEFNVSYAHGMSVIAFALDMKVGVDIEAMRCIEEAAAIARLHYSESERQALFDSTGEEQDTAFLKLWTRKEAFIKAIGQGLYFPLREFSVPLDDTVIDFPDNNRAGTDWVVHDISPNRNYIAALVCDCRDVGINRYWFS